MSRRPTVLLCSMLLFALTNFCTLEAAETGDASTQLDTSRPHILIVTVDDMNRDSVGVFGCDLADTSPNIDRFASTGLRFEHAHVQTGSCYPSRNVLFSGRYSHNTGVEGFYQVPDADYPHLVDVMKDAGYFVAIRGKVSHSTPYQPYGWDADLTEIDGEPQHAKDPLSYYRSTALGIELATKSNQPFCLNINISDPHKPFYATGKRGETVDDPFVPSKVFAPDDIPVPGFLFDHPDVRRELSQYYSSVRRADDCFGQVMRALDESGQRDRTLVIFLSDHGMPLPFAKTGVWNHSTRTPWIVSWPSVTSGGTIDADHMISAVDLLPTLVDVIQAEPPTGFDGRSFLPVLRGQPQPERTSVYKFHNENSGRNRSPMRSVQTKRFGYVFSAWPDGRRVFKTATTGTMTFRAMQQLATSDPTIAARLDLFQHGTPEEFYDYENDPDAKYNLIDDPSYAEEIKQLRVEMLRYMDESGDPLLPVFKRREDREFASAYVDQIQAATNAREAAKRGKRAPSRSSKRKLDLIEVTTSKSATAGQALSVMIVHEIPRRLGPQKLHVTLKDADNQRIERKVIEINGNGQSTIPLNVPANLSSQTVTVAAFVGPSYPENLQHVVTEKIPLTQP